MKRIILSALYLLSSYNLLAQTSWNLGGNTVSTSQRLGTNNAYSLIFETNGSDRGRITSGGNWGIGTTNPLSKLHVNSTVSGQSPFRVDVEGSNKVLMDQYGTFAIGTPIFSTSYKLLISSSTQNGIYSNGLDYGMKASSKNVGVLSYGDIRGVHGYSNTTSGVGVYGYAEQGTGGHFTSFNGLALRAGSTNGFYAAIFDGNTYAYGSYYGSDKNIKKNIQELGNAMSIINKLKTYNYEFRDDGKYASLHLPKGIHYGLLAQEVEEVLPNLVKESPHEISDSKLIIKNEPSAGGEPAIPAITRAPKESINIKAVNYNELIPFLIKALQEQQQTISTLTERINKLEAGSSTGNNMNLGNLDLNGVSLEQNSPNPAGENTTFNYTIPPGVNAKIMIYEASSGKLIKTLPAPTNGKVQMNTNGLQPGNYIYGLMLNGKLAISKQMILAR